jgi:hypothetical protein
MLKAIRQNSIEAGKRIRADYPIALSCHIQCSDSIHQGDFDYLAGVGHPVVFNNSCSSSHELAANFIHAGARCYIGTLWSVGNETAQKAAREFYGAVSKEGNLLRAFFAMSNLISNMRYKNVYIFWGLPISTYRKPSFKSTLRIQGALANSYFGISEAEAKSTDPFAKDHHSEARKFLWKEMKKNALRGRVGTSTDEQLSRSERGTPERHPTAANSSFDRAVREIEFELPNQADDRSSPPIPDQTPND